MVKKRFGLGHRPCGRGHAVTTEASECVDPQIAVDQHEALALGDHDHRHLLAELSHRRDQTSTTITVANPQVIVSKLELVQVDVHAGTLHVHVATVEACA